MQLHAYLLLFIITTGKVLALLHQQCGGTVLLDQEPTGHISLSVPGLLTDTNSPINHQTDRNLPVRVCTWTIDIPLGLTVRLEVAWLESGSSVSVRCVWDQEEQYLETRGVVLLAACDRNNAALTWRGAGHSSNTIQLSYYVQEVERNSSEHHTSSDSDQDLSATPPWSQTGTSYSRRAPIVPQQGQKAARGTEKNIGHLYVGRGWSPWPRSASGPSSDQGLLHPPSSQQGLTMAGTADRETTPLPQEEPDNGADTSGVAHITEGHTSARVNRHTYFHTQHTLTTDTLPHTSQPLSTETYTHMPHALHRDTLPHTQKTAVSSSNTDTVLGTDPHKYTVIHTSKHTDGHVATHPPRIDPTVSSSSALPLTPSPPQPSVLRSQETGTILIPQGGPVDGEPEEKQPHAWRSQRSTDRLHSSMATAVTSDPLKSPSEPQRNDSNNTQTVIGTTASSSSQGPSRTHQSSTTHSTDLDSSVGTVTAASSYPDLRQTVTSDITIQTAAFGSSDRSESRKMLHTLPPRPSPAATQAQTKSPQIQHTASLTHSPPSYTISPFSQTDNVTHTERRNVKSKPGDFTNTYTTSKTFSPKESPPIASSDEITPSWTLTSSGSPPLPTAPHGLGDVVQNSTAVAESGNNMTGEDSLQGTGTDTKTDTLHPTHALSPDVPRTHTSLPVSSPTHAPSLPPTVPRGDASSIPEYRLPTQTVLPDSLDTTHTPPPLTSDLSTTESSMYTSSKTMPTPLQTPTPKSLSTHTMQTSVPLRLLSSPTPKQSHDNITTTPTPKQSHDYITTIPTPKQSHDYITTPKQSHDYITTTPTPKQPHDYITTTPTHKQSHDYVTITPTPKQSHDYITTTPTHKQSHDYITTTPTHKQSHDYITTTHTALPTNTPTNTEPGQEGGGGGADKRNEPFIISVAPSQWSPSGPTTPSLTAGPPQQPPSWTDPYPSQEGRVAGTSASPLSPTWTSITTPTPKFYIVPDQPATITVESIELLLQIIVEESSSAFTAGLEDDTTTWLEPYLLRAPGFSRLLGVWSSGSAVQSLVEFRTRGALDWLGVRGPASLLERTGLAQAVREGRRFRSSKVTNITVGGLQGEVCDWLLQCPTGYQCVSQPGTANHSCSSVCHSDYCHHHGICTHHPGQLPVCRCLVGEDFWYMGRRCDMKMTRARLVGACLAILIVMMTLIAILALVAVRRYRAILIQAKVDQTRSSYRRFNHFDELSGRFWLRSWAASADSLDNPAFTRSDELLHLRALDRTCCYHDDTLSLASTCPSNGTHVNTVYPHSSQYGWRGSEMSVGDCVLDSGKASDLSVCSWPVEPIQWTPFPLLQQLASHRTPTVRASRPRSYCEGMELVDLGKSWTA